MNRLEIPGLTNAWIVDERVWRSAQPPASAWQAVAQAGCKSVIDLNSSGAAIETQRNLVQGFGMEYASLDWSGIIPPSQEEIAAALAYLGVLGSPIAPLDAPVLIHCEHGEDRTGTLCAIYRMAHDKWPFHEAMEEAFFSLGGGGMHEFWFAAAAAEYAKAHGVPL